MAILSETDHQQALSAFEHLLDQEPTDTAAITTLRDALAAYERAQGYELPAPQTLVGRLELEMYRRRLNKKKLAELLEISASRLSDVFQGRRINLDLAKRLHQKLGIPGDFILETA
jgi:HTH-type transcriptional regulator/antitoxin HigA